MKPAGFYDLTPPVTFADIENDNVSEIIILTASKLYILDDQFHNKANFPVSLDPRILTNNSSAPSIADMNGDDILDILFMDANYRIWCYSGYDGSLLNGFPVKIDDIDRYEMTALTITDLDQDGDLEFAIGVKDGVMIVYDYPENTSNRPVFDKYRGDLCNSGLYDPFSPSTIEDEGSIIRDLELLQNYPNPFNPITQIQFKVPEDNLKLKIKVFNVKGEFIFTVFDGIKDQGIHTVNFDGSNLNSGVYYYQLTAEGSNRSRRMLLLK